MTEFNEDSLKSLEEEILSPRIKLSTRGRPPLVLGPMKRIPEISISSKKTEDSVTKLEEDGKITELKILYQSLEKENLQLKSGKEDLKVQLGICIEKSKKERENYIKHEERVIKEKEALQKKVEKLEKKIKRRDDKIERLKNENYSLYSDLQQVEKSSLLITEDKDRLRYENIRIQGQLCESETRINNLSKKINELIEENTVNQTRISHLSSTNQLLQTDIDLLTHGFSISKELCIDDENGGYSIASYQKKAESLLNSYKKRIQTLENEREEALTKQTSLTFELQRLRSERAILDEEYRMKIIAIESHFESIREEKYEFKLKVEDERYSRKNIERKSVVEKTELEIKLAKALQSIQDLMVENSALEYNIAEYKEKAHKMHDDLEAEEMKIKGLEDKCNSLKNKVEKYKDINFGRNKELENVYSIKESLELENFTLREHLKSATTNEFTDPVNLIIQDQVEVLERKLRETENNLAKEKSTLSAKIKLLESQVCLLEKQKKALSENYEKQLNKLRTENSRLVEQGQMLKDSFSFEAKDSGQILAEIQKENINESLQILHLETKDLKSKLIDTQEELKNMEKKYIEAKMGWVNADIERESAVHKYKDAQEQLKDFSSQYTMMEVEMYKINERFGQTLNINNELEMEVNQLKALISQSNKKKKFFDKLRG